MKTIYKHMKVIIAGLLLISLAGCSDDEDPVSVNTDWGYSAVGEWLSDLGEPVKDVKEVYVSTYNNDGTWSGSLAYVDNYTSSIIPVDGTYIITGKKFTQTTNMLGETSTVSYQILSLGKYDWMMFYPESEMTDLSHRIVDTIHMEEGQSDYIQINDPDFHPMGYTSDDEDVVEVSPTGTILAKRAGTAYISVVSSIGTAVIRIVVTDPETYIDNYVHYLGEDKSVVTNAYGTISFSYDYGDGTSVQIYNLIDNNISDASFYYTNNRVDSIDVWLNETAEISKILSAFDEAYKFLTDFNGIKYYRTAKNVRAVKVLYFEDYNAIRIMYYDPEDPFVDLDNLIRMKASEAIEKLGHVLTDEERAEGKFYELVRNPLFYAVRIEFEPEYDYIHNVTLYCKNDISISDIEYWYEQNYIPTGKEHQFGQLNPLILINLTSSEDGSTHVMYIK